jgi:hypothetical protein
MECLALRPTSIDEKWRTLGKTYGIEEARCYLGTPVRNNIGNWFM